jgi:hypothetical protein
MTPDQLKDYIDAAVKQRDSFTLAYFIVVPIISIFGSFIVTFARSYSTEKGKNAATKEDVGRITTEIEASRSHFSERLEHLRAELSSRAHYGKVRYEREMKVFEEVWPKLCTLRDAVLSLRPVIDFSLKPEETEEQRKKERAEQFFDAYMALRETVDHSRHSIRLSSGPSYAHFSILVMESLWIFAFRAIEIERITGIRPWKT